MRNGRVQSFVLASKVDDWLIRLGYSNDATTYRRPGYRSKRKQIRPLCGDFDLPRILLGGTFALACDTLARTVLTGEIPLGIIASFLGALLFMAMMLSGNVRVQR